MLPFYNGINWSHFSIMGCSPSKKTSRTASNGDSEMPSKHSIDSLPDDILFNIFSQLSTEDRKPLSLVSKRFRFFDLETGKRDFEKIIFGPGYLSDYELRAGSYQFLVDPVGDYQDQTPFISKFFKNANTQLLAIEVDENHDSKAARDLATIFKSLSFKNLYITFEGSKDLSDFAHCFFTELKIKGDCNVVLVWDCEVPQNIQRLRETLLKLPKIKSQELMYQVRDGIDSEESEVLIDDSIMLQLVRNCEWTRIISLVNCTGQGINEAFDIICASQNDSKFMAIDAPRTAIDEFFNIAKEYPGFKVTSDEEGLRILTDSHRGGCLEEESIDYYDATTSITITKSQK